MNDSPEYIEAYFEKQLGEAEMRQFELRCEQDDLFARDVASYITTREAVKQLLAEQRKEQWRTLSQEQPTNVVPAVPVRTMLVRRWLPYASAACVILFIALFIWNNNSGLNTQVSSDIKNEMGQWSQDMGVAKADRDSILERSKSAYSHKDYALALTLLTPLAKADSTDEVVIQAAGSAQMMQKNYDSALVYFRQLSHISLEHNKGPYFTALTLLKRNKNGDKDEAKKELQAVLDNDHFDGKKEAQTLLDLMK